jgi:hypothetical protein
MIAASDAAQEEEGVLQAVAQGQEQAWVPYVAERRRCAAGVWLLSSLGLRL